MKKVHGIWYLEYKKPDRSGSITAVARELVRYKLDLVGVQSVQWGHNKSRRLKLFLWIKKRQSSTGNLIFVHHRIESAVTRVEYVKDRVSYLVLRGRWYNIIFQKVHAKEEEKL